MNEEVARNYRRLRMEIAAAEMQEKVTLTPELANENYRARIEALNVLAATGDLPEDEEARVWLIQQIGAVSREAAHAIVDLAKIE